MRTTREQDGRLGTVPGSSEGTASGEPDRARRAGYRGARSGVRRRSGCPGTGQTSS